MVTDVPVGSMGILRRETQPSLGNQGGLPGGGDIDGFFIDLSLHPPFQTGPRFHENVSHICLYFTVFSRD